MSPIHRKTPKGIAEFETRSHGLTARMRSVLILVDGQRSDAEICDLLGPQAESLLVELTWQNFIERMPDAPLSAKSGRSTRPSARRLAAATAGASRRTAEAPANLQALRQHAVSKLTERLGPFAQNLAVSIERAHDHRELQALLERASGLIENMLGTEAANSFRTELKSLNGS